MTLTKVINLLPIFLFPACSTTSNIQSNTPLIDSAISHKVTIQTGPFEIRPDDKFEIHSYDSDSSYNSDVAMCKSERPTEKEIRRQFQLAHRLEGRDLHDNYIWTPCFAKGTISRNGRIMKWRFRIGNVIETTFPDGKDKILGGETTDSLSGK